MINDSAVGRTPAPCDVVELLRERSAGADGCLIELTCNEAQALLAVLDRARRLENAVIYWENSPSLEETAKRLVHLHEIMEANSSPDKALRR